MQREPRVLRDQRDQQHIGTASHLGQQPLGFRRDLVVRVSGGGLHPERLITMRQGEAFQPGDPPQRRDGVGAWLGQCKLEKDARLGGIGDGLERLRRMRQHDLGTEVKLAVGERGSHDRGKQGCGGEQRKKGSEAHEGGGGKGETGVKSAEERCWKSASVKNRPRPGEEAVHDCR